MVPELKWAWLPVSGAAWQPVEIPVLGRWNKNEHFPDTPPGRGYGFRYHLTTGDK